MNIGPINAEPKAWRPIRKPKIEPVPVVSSRRQTKAARPAQLDQTFMRRSIMVHR